MTYSVSDVHMNEDIYTNPKKFDPERFEVGRAEDKVYFGYLGCGGRFNSLYRSFVKGLNLRVRTSSVSWHDGCDARNQDHTYFFSPGISL